MLRVAEAFSRDCGDVVMALEGLVMFQGLCF